ncbi:MAG TPA: sigma-70 family RNA polymerase sigma factor [Candidatus Avanaerovorax faecigallinarum]|nr:sigma-70 family RNA polymerase sigma factor [Candidatus Avanaerovorax faecigallinarum]
MEYYFNLYKDSVFSTGFNWFKNPVDADDIVQETFFRLFRCNRDFESEDHLRFWIIRVAVNECKRVSLSSWFKKKVSLDDYAQTLVFHDPGESRLFSAVMNLPSKYRQVIHLIYYEGYSTAEIADLLNISQTAVTTRLQRGRQRLKKELEVCER